MKILLLQPPVRDFYDTPVRLHPLGLCYLKAALLEHLPGVQVAVRDYHAGWGRRTAPLPAELGYLREYYPAPDRSPFSTFHAYYHFGASFADLAEEVTQERPDLVGISSLFSAYHREVLASAEAIKARLDVPVVVGGSHASAAPESLLAHSAVDFVIRGEGERPLVELVRALGDEGALASVPNLVFRRGGELVHNPLEENYPVAAIPHPDHSDLPLQRYRLGRRPLVSLIASRGCPHRCRFCSVHATFGYGYRRRPVADILREIRALYAQGFRAFDFEDDNLTLPREAMAELCDALIRGFPTGEIALQAMNGVAYQSLDPELLALMRRAGFSHLNLSLVSLDEGVCRAAERPHAPVQFQSVVEAAFRLGLRTVCYQILGLPGESLASMLDTLIFTARLPVLLGASPFYLPPGSPIAEVAPAQTVGDLVRCRLTAMGRDDRDTVYTLFVATRIINFLKGLPLTAEQVDLDEALEHARRGGERAALGADLLEELLATGSLYAVSRQGREFLPRFRFQLFRELWNRLGRITAQSGARILIPADNP